MNERMALPHQLIMEERQKLSITGIEEVESFDENLVVMVTNKGNLQIRGEGLHISKLNLDNGDVQLQGDIVSIEYDDMMHSRGGIFSKLFG